MKQDFWQGLTAEKDPDFEVPVIPPRSADLYEKNTTPLEFLGVPQPHTVGAPVGFEYSPAFSLLRNFHLKEDVDILFNDTLHLYAVFTGNWITLQGTTSTPAGEWIILRGSASTVKSIFFPHFDGPKIAGFMVNGKGWPKSQYRTSFWEGVVKDLGSMAPASKDDKVFPLTRDVLLDFFCQRVPVPGVASEFMGQKATTTEYFRVCADNDLAGAYMVYNHLRKHASPEPLVEACVPSPDASVPYDLAEIIRGFCLNEAPEVATVYNTVATDISFPVDIRKHLIDHILKTWNETAEAGTAAHLGFELLENGEPVPEELASANEHKIWLPMSRAIKVTHKPLSTERRMSTRALYPPHPDNLQLGGSADSIWVAREQPDTKTLLIRITDYKRIKDLTMTGGDKGWGPCAHLRSNKHTQFSIAMNFYAWVLETYYQDITWEGVVYEKFKVTSMELIVVHPSQDSARMIGVNHDRKLVTDILQYMRIDPTRDIFGRPLNNIKRARME